MTLDPYGLETEQRHEPLGIGELRPRLSWKLASEHRGAEQGAYRITAAATAGDLDPFRRLVDVVTSPYDARPGLEAYAEPAPDSFGAYRTFCGT